MDGIVSCDGSFDAPTADQQLDTRNLWLGISGTRFGSGVSLALRAFQHSDWGLLLGWREDFWLQFGPRMDSWRTRIGSDITESAMSRKQQRLSILSKSFLSSAH